MMLKKFYNPTFKFGSALDSFPNFTISTLERPLAIVMLTLCDQVPLINSGVLEASVCFGSIHLNMLA